MTGDPCELTVAILAGGLGTRLRPALRHCPKVLAPVGGRPFLAHLLDRLHCAGVREVVLLAGYRAGQLHDAFGDHYESIRLRYSVEEKPLGTGGALCHALPLLQAPAVLLLNGDSYCDADLDSFARHHSARPGGVSLVLTHVPDTSRFGRVESAEDGGILRFDEEGTDGSGWINAGIYLLPRQRLAALPGSCSLERDVMPGWIVEGNVFGYRHVGRFLDIGTPESYAEAERFLEPSLAAG